MVLSCRPFVVLTTFSTGLVGVEVRRQKKSDLLFLNHVAIDASVGVIILI